MYAATVTAALLGETMRCFDQWCSLSARFLYVLPVHASVAGVSLEPAGTDGFEDVDDLPRITNEEMLANPRSMEFNIELHELQERVFAGQSMDAFPY